MKPVRRLPEERGLLLQIEVDAGEKKRRARALILFLQRQRQIDGNQLDLMAKLPKLLYQRIIAETISAIHCAGPGGNLNDIQSFLAVGFSPLARSLARSQFRNERAMGFRLETSPKRRQHGCAVRFQ